MPLKLKPLRYSRYLTKPLRNPIRRRRRKCHQNSPQLTSRNPNKNIQIRYLVYFLCTVVFIYQVWNFINHYYTFPTSVDAAVKINDNVLPPASTVCPSLEVVRLWISNDSLKIVSQEEVEQFQLHTMRNIKLVSKCGYIYENDTKIFLNIDYSNRSWVYNGFQLCFIINGAWNPLPKADGPFAEFFYEVDVYNDIEIDMNRMLGFDLFIHSDKIFPTRSIRTYYLETGASLKTVFKKTVVNLLPPPYKTKCFNYTKQLLKSRKFRNIGRDTCLYECMWIKLNDICGCVPNTIPSFFALHNCTEKCVYIQDKVRVFCESKCPMACRTEYFDFAITKLTDFTREDMTKTLMHLELRGCTEVIFTHRPKFKVIETFSFIGGFLGVWLGICIPNIIQGAVYLLHSFERKTSVIGSKTDVAYR